MRRSALVTAAAFSLLAASAQAQALLAPVDQAVAVNLPGNAADVVVGNPAIADVQLLNARQAIVLGKGYGVTSLQVFDALGRSIFARQIVVSSADQNRVTYYRGPAVASYACAPRCEAVGKSDDANPAAGAASPAATPVTPPAAPAP